MVNKIGVFDSGIGGLSILNELKKVRWPDKKYIIKYTIVTLVFVFVIAMYFFGWSALMAFLKSLLRG